MYKKKMNQVLNPVELMQLYTMKKNLHGQIRHIVIDW